MGRGRIPMELIQKEKARKTTFIKRKNGLMKKVYEFSTLCGVDVCIIVYGPNFEGQVSIEPETWPKDINEVHRILQKYHNTTSDRRPKIYDVQEYYKDRMRKIEADICKVQKDKLKIMYPEWSDSFNNLSGEQLGMFIGQLDAKIDACNQRIDMLRQDPKGKAIVEPNKVEAINPYLASNPSSQFTNYQAQFFSSNQVPLFYPIEQGQSSQPYSMLQFGQNCMQLIGGNGMVNWGDQIGGSLAYDHKIDHTLNDISGAENNQNLLPSYYNGNMQTMQPHSFALHPPTSQNLQYQAALPPPLPPPQPDVLPGFQLNGLYDTNMLQAQMFNYMHGRK